MGGITVGSGRILITDTDGSTAFDTDEKLFTVTNFLSGGFAVPARTAVTTGTTPTTIIDVDTNHSITAINAYADTVRGAFSASASTSQGVVGFGYFNASGTYVHYNENGFMALTFLCISGVLYLHERTVLRAASTTIGLTNTETIQSVTLSYKLFCGTWV